MNPWLALNRAIIGWRMIARGEPGWAAEFARNPAGLAMALAIFALMAFLAVAIASTQIGMPGFFAAIAAMLVLSIPVMAFALVLWATRRMLPDQRPVLDVLVPGIYAATGFVAIEGILALIGGPLVVLAWLGLGYLLYRLGRVAAHWHGGIAAGFAVLSVGLLVAMRLALYMVSSIPALSA